MSNGNGVSRGDRDRNARLSRLRVLVPVSRGEPHAALRNDSYLAGHRGGPARPLINPITRCWAHPIRLCRDRRQARHRTKGLTQNDLR
jgi:transposase